MRAILLAMLLVSAPAISTPAMAQDKDQDGKFEDKAEDVARQPFRDIGIVKEKVPAILEKYKDDPYSLKGISTCAQYRAAVTELTEALGADVDAKDEKGEPVASRLAESGAKSIVGSIIPLRGLVREVSGAAGNDRRIAAAVVVGTARRGFLKGSGTAKGCSFPK